MHALHTTATQHTLSQSIGSQVHKLICTIARSHKHCRKETMARRTPCLLLRGRSLLSLLLVIILTASTTAAAQGSVPACSELTLRSKVRSSPRTLAPGTKVSVRLTVKNAGATAVSGVTVRMSSSVLVGWKATGPTVSRRIDGASVYWLGQELKPRQTRKYKAHARICAAAVGFPVVVQGAAYRLKATTGDVLCSNGATPLNVGQLDWSDEEGQERVATTILVSFHDLDPPTSMQTIFTSPSWRASKASLAPLCRAPTAVPTQVRGPSAAKAFMVWGWSRQMSEKSRRLRSAAADCGVHIAYITHTNDKPFLIPF